MQYEWQTVGELLRARARDRATDRAVDVAGRCLSYGELDRLSDRVGANLAARGIGKSDRVTSFAFNSIEQLLVWFEDRRDLGAAQCLFDRRRSALCARRRGTARYRGR